MNSDVTNNGTKVLWSVSNTNLDPKRYWLRRSQAQVNAKASSIYVYLCSVSDIDRETYTTGLRLPSCCLWQSTAPTRMMKHLLKQLTRMLGRIMLDRSLYTVFAWAPEKLSWSGPQHHCCLVDSRSLICFVLSARFGENLLSWSLGNAWFLLCWLVVEYSFRRSADTQFSSAIDLKRRYD